jgi:hypothetical protein
MTVAAMINCPSGVLSTLPAFKALTAMPVEVGAKQNPIAIADVVECPNSKEIDNPMRIGPQDPTKPVSKPLHMKIKISWLFVRKFVTRIRQ